MFYLASYAFMNLGAFAIVAHFSRTHERLRLDRTTLPVLSQKQPVVAALFTVFLLSLIRRAAHLGFLWQVLHPSKPPSIRSSLARRARPAEQRRRCLLYLRVIVVMYFHEPGQSVETSTAPPAGINITTGPRLSPSCVLGVVPPRCSQVRDAVVLLGK
jgi:NADH-quinone oxidoreductase subunit N